MFKAITTNMNSLNYILNIFSGQGQILSLDGFALVLIGYLLLSWFVCVAAAFLKVKEVQYYIGLISMGLTLMIALVLGGLFRNFLPDLANSFTPGGLFLLSSVVGILVCSVPVIQYSWNISFWRGLACVVVGICVLFGAVILFQVLAHPNEPIPARLSVPLFQKGGPGLSL